MTNTKRHERSEKWLEQYLRKQAAAHGALCLKYSSMTTTGYPDRMILFPRGVTVWVELKSYGKRPTELQESRMRKLRELGFPIFVADTPEKVEDAVKEGIRLSRLASASPLTDTSSAP